ncbi:cuticlin-5 [Schistocerca americana]|uniref:cuticlin-5 n=1 Tax=Schistocerca americana TaxID=7009 RepID=UPI001F500257|nr:cuticlin-5 [Schistocerca americana]
MLTLRRWIVLRSARWIVVVYAALLSGLRSQELVDGSGSVPTELYDAVDVITAGAANGSDRAALAHDASHHRPVVFVGDGSHVSGPHVRSRPLRPVAADDLDWRLHDDVWDREYRRHHHNATRVHHIEAECQDEYMKIRIGFNGSFHGLLYSSGYADDRDCVYINGTGRDYYEFYIQLNRCGTLGKNSHHEDSRKIPTKNFMWNTVTVQYNPLIEEEWDEHFKVTCEYGYDFWKTVTFPFLDVEVATGNPVVFTLSPPECYMEIRYGYGTTGNRVSGPVRVGDPLTLIIYMRTKYDGFDIVVNDCFAHNGGNKRIQLIDQYGCPVDEKLISRFRGAWSETGVFETQVFAYMKTFRFTGSPALYIECDVRMCHGRCPSQPCHWRNTKSVSKRAVPENPAAQSENINLFQSLRVLQDDEISENSPLNGTVSDQNKVCLRTGAFTTLLGVGCTFLSLLSLSVVLLCHRVRRLNKDRDVMLDKSLPSFEHKTFVTHKGRIN